MLDGAQGLQGRTESQPVLTPISIEFAPLPVAATTVLCPPNPQFLQDAIGHILHRTGKLFADFFQGECR